MTARTTLALAASIALAALAGCATGDDTGGARLGLSDPAGILDESGTVTVYAIKLYESAPSCADVEGGVDVVGMAPRGSIVTIANADATAGQATIQIPNGDYLLVVEAYSIDGNSTLGVGCAAVRVGGDDSITITLVPLAG